MSDEKDKDVDKEEVDDMAVLAKPVNRIHVVKVEESKEFIKELNKSLISDELLESCKKAGRLFDKQK